MAIASDRSVSIRRESKNRIWPLGRYRRCATPIEAIYVFRVGKERDTATLIDLKGLFRDLIEPLGDRITVERPEGHNLQNQQVERALKEGRSYQKA